MRWRPAKDDDTRKTDPRAEPESAALRRGTLWNFAAFGVMVAAGLLLNVLIGGQSGPVALGVFNQTYAVVVLVSHIAVLGLHYSALTHTARESSPPIRHAIAQSALALTLVTGAVGVTALALAAPAIGAVLGSPDTEAAILFAAPGVFFLAINKVLLGLANGRREMRAFAVGQGARYILMLVVAVLWWLWAWPLEMIGLVFTLPEAIVTVFFGAWSAARIRGRNSVALGPWMRRHLGFGARGWVHGLLAEMNVRVDVLMLGLFLGDREVGLYSFAAMLAEGFLNVLAVVRNQVNPLLANHLANNRKDDILRLARFLLPRVWLAGGVLTLLILAAYPLAVAILMPAGDYAAVWPVLAILLAGMTIYGAIAPFDAILMQGGRPGWQSTQMALTVTLNAGLNAALIPLFALTGAACATAVSLLCGGVVILLFCRKLLGLDLFYRSAMR